MAQRAPAFAEPTAETVVPSGPRDRSVPRREPNQVVNIVISIRNSPSGARTLIRHDVERRMLARHRRPMIKDDPPNDRQYHTLSAGGPPVHRKQIELVKKLLRAGRHRPSNTPVCINETARIADSNKRHTADVLKGSSRRPSICRCVLETLLARARRVRGPRYLVSERRWVFPRRGDTRVSSAPRTSWNARLEGGEGEQRSGRVGLARSPIHVLDAGTIRNTGWWSDATKLSIPLHTGGASAATPRRNADWRVVLAAAPCVRSTNKKPVRSKLGPIPQSRESPLRTMRCVFCMFFLVGFVTEIKDKNRRCNWRARTSRTRLQKSHDCALHSIAPSACRNDGQKRGALRHRKRRRSRCSAEHAGTHILGLHKQVLGPVEDRGRKPRTQPTNGAAAR